MISGTDPTLGFRLAKYKPLLRLIYIHSENRMTTFSRQKIYAGFFDVGNRLMLWPDGRYEFSVYVYAYISVYIHPLTVGLCVSGCRYGDWERALMLSPMIKKLPKHEGEKFYCLEGRKGYVGVYRVSVHM